MRQGPSPTKNFILSILLLAAALSVAAGAALSVYTSQDHQRSVVRNRDTDTIRFSSDKLYRVTGGEPQKYFYSATKSQREMQFYVCNYDQERPTLFCEKDIEYLLEFRLNNTSLDANQYAVRSADSTYRFENGVCTFTDSLPGGDRSLKTYSLDFGEGDFEQLEWTVKVTPVNPTVTQGRILQAVLIPVEYIPIQGVSVKAEFSDSSRGKAPSAYAAYNITITIRGGDGRVKLTWDKERLDIDPYFTARVNGTETDGGIVIPMNPEDETGTCQATFFNHLSQMQTWSDWNELWQYIHVELIDSTENT